MATYWENSCSFGLRYVSWYKYLIVGLVFSRLGFWSGNLFLIAPFPDLCLLVPFSYVIYYLSINVQFLHGLHPSIFQKSTRYRRKLKFYLTSTCVIYRFDCKQYHVVVSSYLLYLNVAFTVACLIHAKALQEFRS